MSRFFVPLVALLGVLVASVVHAADPTTAPKPGFSKDTITLATTLAAATAMDNRETTFVASEVNLNYFVIDDISLGLALRGATVNRQGPNTWQGELAGVFRQHFARWDRYTIFADVTAGISEAGEEIPAGGTYFNFVTRAGLGATARINETMYLMAGTRFFHISNARIEGDDSNPSVNGLEGYVSLVWRLR